MYVKDSNSKAEDRDSLFIAMGVGGGREKKEGRGFLEVGKRIGRAFSRNLYIDAKEPVNIG